MIALTAEEDFEVILDRLEAQGHDMTKMRDYASAVAAIEVGDPTPAPGSLRVVEPSIILPPMHEGLNEPPEGKFYLPPFQQATSMPRQVRRLRRHLNRLTYFVIGFAMCFVSSLAVIAYRWNG